LYTDAGQTLVVEQPQTGIELVDLLATWLPAAHRTELRALLSEGRVRVNGEPCLSNRRLRAGDVVQVRVEAPLRSRAAAHPVAPSPEVLFESESALVIDKTAGLPTVPDRSGRERSVHGLLPELRPGADLRIVHRLDRDTSGCLLLAKGVEAARHFDLAFREARVHKTYVALVHGASARAEFAIDAWLGPDRRRPGRVVAAARRRPGFRAAHTDVRCRETFTDFALFELRPATGRGHQLRVHLQSAGHPIVGDAAYGGEPLLLSRLKPGYKQRRGVAERPLLARMFLHAERLEFTDVDGKAVAVEAPLPQDLSVALNQLQRCDDRRRRPCD
jgi:23S rRNA pseudouridine955/2504/2580 synthase/23S rRNA pseudouridine1911/1915/1917 synthase